MDKPFHRPLLFAALATVSAPSVAQPAVTTRIVKCDAGDCLLVRGQRESRQATVRINGRSVDVSGANAWRVALPVATVRDWSALNARTLDVAVSEPGAATERNTAVRLPVGMLAHNVELAFLVVRAR